MEEINWEEAHKVSARIRVEFEGNVDNDSVSRLITIVAHWSLYKCSNLLPLAKYWDPRYLQWARISHRCPNAMVLLLNSLSCWNTRLGFYTYYITRLLMFRVNVRYMDKSLIIIYKICVARQLSGFLFRNHSGGIVC